MAETSQKDLEPIAINALGVTIFRLTVPGGWLYLTRWHPSVEFAQTFVPDPKVHDEAIDRLRRTIGNLGPI